ncbi:MAG: BlaI/MecI/CopY family transcriptional regulator [Bacteroides sp.]|nr:BlaI/MecI/CopY family transcriptional regulator [Bacteroides sp.]
MKALTAKEEEIMGWFWEKGPLFVKEMLAFYSEPRPHFNTLSTMVRLLEEKGYVAHRSFGNSHQYYAVVSEADYSRRNLRSVISKYFNNSYLSAVSSLVREEDISLDELKALIAEVERDGNGASEGGEKSVETGKA